ncbi:MAG TPA: tRNA uridine-5-carboxymethylaminomethyl(34) synthesis GTPase MnmE, partial [Alphaproteobacteria bacterium]|nr:tRNA uridine-5-carboxymethylaminomethyl(34) synthesis GTPase MnmE [Alphaproteobacteria bacterium]
MTGRSEVRGGSAAETIYAVATAVGAAGVAVVRVSGPRASFVLEVLSGRTLEPRRATRVEVRGARDGCLLDSALSLWFPKPASFTGEDTVEFHLHGGRAVVTAVMGEVGGIAGLRVAEPGEFSRRAFINGKLDLTEAEGLADLVAAETEVQRRQALRQLKGELGGLYEGWRQRLLRCLAHGEAELDFVDEDLPADLRAGLCKDVTELAREMADHLDDQRRGERVRDGARVVIVGAPNVGKSSLLNRLARRDVAIVHNVAGTTRDVIEVNLDLSGYPITISDTAGLRESDDEVENEGMRRARMVADSADLVAGLFDASRYPDLDSFTLSLLGAEGLAVFNKTDLMARNLPNTVGKCSAIPVSCKTGAGLDRLMEELRSKAEQMMVGNGSPIISRQRHRESLAACHEALVRFGLANEPELAAEELQ